jgi:hypothetical protein
MKQLTESRKELMKNGRIWSLENIIEGIAQTIYFKGNGLDIKGRHMK